MTKKHLKKHSKKHSHDFELAIKEAKYFNNIFKINKHTFNTYIDSLYQTNEKQQLLNFFNYITLKFTNNYKNLFSKNEISPKFGFTYSLYNYGVTTKNTLHLSKPLILNFSIKELFLLICHEFAHLIDYNTKLSNNQKLYSDDHGKEWIKYYKELSNKNWEELSLFENEVDNKELNQEINKYHSVCENNHTTFSFHEFKKCSTCNKSFTKIIIQYQ